MVDDIQTVVMGLVVAIVMLFVGLYMIQQVSDVASIDNTSSFYTTFTSLITNTGTLYQILVLVLIVVALAVAIAYLVNFGRTSSSAGM